MPVSVMLRTLSSRELTEWRAYERKNGPLDDMWRDEAISNEIDLLRMLSYMFSQANFADAKKSIKGPVEQPKTKYTRPWYMHYPEPESEPEEMQADDDRQIAMLNMALDQRENREAKGG